MRHRTIALGALLSLVVTACGGSAVSPSAPAPSVVPSSAAVASPAASSSVPHGAPATLGGRSVTRIKSLDTNPLGDAWVYAVDDVMYGVQAKDEALAAEVIALLP